MKPHEFVDDETAATLIELAMGALSEPEATELEKHLVICAPCRRELAVFRESVGLLSEAGAPVEPPGELFGRVRARVEQGTDVQPWKSWTAADDPGFIVRGAPEELWEETAIEGIRVRSLSVDREADRVTMLIRMDAGTSYPAHRHGGTEECFVLEGDLKVGSERMSAGDFQRMEEGSEHPVQSTEGGCLLLITSSLEDELLGD